MKVFASRFLEEPFKEQVIESDGWSWTPAGENAVRVYASGAPTNTNQSTYADERDDRSDSDRPNEGMLAA